MKTPSKLLLASAACLALTAVKPAAAETTTTTTTTIVHPQVLPEGAEVVNFDAFDLNHDGILSMDEVGEKLFYSFDTDGNEVIDNQEFDAKQVMTITPMEKDTYTFTDWDNDGMAETATYEYETFYQESGLMRFDKHKDGLTPAEFIGKTLLELDIDKSKVIELDEWEKAYKASLAPDNADNERYN